MYEDDDIACRVCTRMMLREEFVQCCGAEERRERATKGGYKK
jgi:hypothetical protein